MMPGIPNRTLAQLSGLGLWVLTSVSCGGSGATQKAESRLDPVFESLDIRTIAALPFASDISEREDPDRIAAQMAQSKFYRALSSSGYSFLSTAEVAAEVQRLGLARDLDEFYKNWISDQDDFDKDFIRELAAHLNVDAVLAGAVDVWYQEHVDVTESGTARTQVGILIELFDAKSVERLWHDRQERDLQGLRYTATSGVPGDFGSSETERGMRRSNLRTARGAYAPPDFDKVVDLVVGALAEKFPKMRL